MSNDLTMIPGSKESSAAKAPTYVFGDAAANRRVLDQIEALIRRVTSCDHLLDEAAVQEPTGNTTIFIDDLSGCIDCSKNAFAISGSSAKSLAARYAALLNGAVHVLTQMRELQHAIAVRHAADVGFVPDVRRLDKVCGAKS